MRRERCCHWTGAWSSSAAALLIKTSIACFLIVCCSSTAAADPSGAVTTEEGVITPRINVAAAAAAAVAVEAPCDYFVKQEEIAGLEFCPQLEPLKPLLLENKRRLLRLALDAVEDAGGESPLLLLSALIDKTADVFFSQRTTVVGDIEGWAQRKKNPESHEESFDENERFLDVVNAFYEHNLRRSRPVVVYLTGADACMLWDELKPQEVEANAAETSVLSNIGSAASAAAGGNTPLAIVTFGWDHHGSPFAAPAFRECSTNILELPQVVRWFVSHHKYSSPSPKVEHVAIGFGGLDPRSGLKQSEIITPSRNKLSRMDACQAGDSSMEHTSRVVPSSCFGCACLLLGVCSMEVIFQCNNDASNTNRPAINEALQHGGQPEFNASESSVVPRVIPENHYPLGPLNAVNASTNGLFAISPPGTRPDCFRHYEFLLAGNIVYVPDDPSLHIVLAGLPVIFVQGREDGWGKINCDNMVQHAQQVAHRLDQGLKPGGKPPFDYGKLTLRHWIRFVRDRVWQAAAEIRQAGDEARLTGYEPEESEESQPYPEMVVGG